MGSTVEYKLALWRKHCRNRKARRAAAELRRKPQEIKLRPCASRPGGNPSTIAGAYAEQQPRAVMGQPPPKHVPHNPHRAGSIAYALLYSYWIPNATEPR